MREVGHAEIAVRIFTHSVSGVLPTIDLDAHRKASAKTLLFTDRRANRRELRVVESIVESLGDGTPLT